MATTKFAQAKTTKDNKELNEIIEKVKTLENLVNNVEVKIKKLKENAVVPKYAHYGDAGLDLVATSIEYSKDMDAFIYHTGIAVEIPVGYCILIFPRSSNRKTDAYMTNHVGVIDSGYRGEILVTFKLRDTSTSVVNTIAFFNHIADMSAIDNVNNIKDVANNTKEFINKTITDNNFYNSIKPYGIGDRIAQAIVVKYPTVTFTEVDELSESERGKGGHGSTGK